MTWLIKAGDDPAYARADYDDSNWTRFDPNTSLITVFHDRPAVVWYRLHVKVAPDEAGLALMEWNLSSAFEIYVNGERLMQSGKVGPSAPYTVDARLVKRIPNGAIATGSLVIALRVYISSSDWVMGFPGFYAPNLTLGQEDALNDHIWLSVIGQNALTWFASIAGMGLGFIALALFAAQPRQREYLWLFLMYFSAALRLPLEFYRLFHNLPASWEYANLALQMANAVFMTLMYFAFMRIRFPRWIQIILGAAIVTMLMSTIVTAHGFGPALASILTVAPLTVLFAGIIPVLLAVHLRRGNREAGILLLPALISSLTIYLLIGFFLASKVPALSSRAARLEQLVIDPTVGPFTLDVGAVGGCLFVLSLAIILVLRSTRISRQQAVIEAELAAARGVQQVMLPEQIDAVPGFEVESAYEPAQQVGGDFFQILPAGEGGLLLAIGDVAGKGLPAAMLVSVLVGAIRGVAEYTSDPTELLANLNERLVGRVDGGFSTALVARIAADGAVTTANAGHLPPYLDGREVDLPGALPLGVKSGMRYEAVHFELPPESRLTFYSDGIVEAQNSKGELFGFDRGRDLSTRPVTDIVDAAKKFGQKDDITAISIKRVAAIATAA
jgi:hypothetical protein